MKNKDLLYTFIKQSKTKNVENKSRTWEIKRFIPGNNAKRCCPQGHTQWLEDFCHVNSRCVKGGNMFIAHVLRI